MKEIKSKIKDIKNCIEDLEMQGIYIDINIDDIEDCVEQPEEYDCTPSALVDDAICMVEDVKDIISKLYSKLDKLQDLLYEKDL